MTKTELFYAMIEDAVADLTYYDRNEDEDLNRDDLDKLIKDEEINVHTAAAVFGAALQKHFDKVTG